MTTWLELGNLLRTKPYAQLTDNDAWALTYDVGSGRAQKVLAHQLNDTWITVLSAFAGEDEVLMRDALLYAENAIYLPLVTVNDLHMVRIDIHLPDASLTRIEELLEVVAIQTDCMERAAAGADSDRF